MVNIVGGRTLVPPSVGGPPLQDAKMTARAILQCRPNSHPFPERTLVLDQPVKIGRSVARARPATNNAIFDCKVLSRNHALLWYENGKFFLQDTKSSNGTFVNNQRLSKGSEESAPREVCSGDIVQFGVDVMENSRKVTHGCIVATLKLYMPDGQEAKASPSTMVGGAVSSVSAQELYQLRTYLQEATHREHQIETKLATLQRLVSSTQEAATQSWNAMIDEDRLLQRLETLEAQLTTYSKNYPEGSVREEMRRLLDEKGQYETTAKESLRRVLQEKLDAVTKLADLERTLSSSEDELSHMKELCEATQKELQELLEKQTTQTEQVALLTDKLKTAEDQLKDVEENFEQEKKEMENKLLEKNTEENKLLARIESLRAESDFTKEQLSAVKAKYENIKNGGGLIRPKDAGVDVGEGREGVGAWQREVFSLRDRLQEAQEELRQSEANVTQLQHEAELADSAEVRCQKTRARLQEEVAEVRAKAAGSQALTEHLQTQVSALQDRLSMFHAEGHRVKIYDDIYDETLVRRKKDSNKNKNKLNDEGREDDCKDDNDDTSLNNDPDTTLTIIPTKDPCKESNVNGSVEEEEEEEEKEEEGKEEGIHESILRADILRLQGLLEASEAAAAASEAEEASIREELAQAAAAAVTAAHEAANLRQQLAASEAAMGEKVKAVSALQAQVTQLEGSARDVQASLASLEANLRDEQGRVHQAMEEATNLRRKLAEAEQLASLSVEEAESLKQRISGLEERLGHAATPLITDMTREETLTHHEDSIPDETTDGPPTLTGPDLTENQELGVLRESVKRLQEELSVTQQQFVLVQERERTLQQALERERERAEDAGTSPGALNELSPAPSRVERLHEEMRMLKEERNSLRERLGLMDEDYQVLAMQNKTTIPTWVMVVMVMALALGSELIPNLL